jgi:preprotein translocase subunit SecD
MSGGFKISFKGDTNSLFKKQLEALAKRVDSELGTQAGLIKSGAVRAIDTQDIRNTGGLRSTIIQKRVEELRWTIGSPKNYARLQEEGATMTRAQLQAQLKNIPKQADYQPKGVVEIRGNSAIWKARPYLYPAFEQAKEQLARAIKRITG